MGVEGEEGSFDHKIARFPFEGTGNRSVPLYSGEAEGRGVVTKSEMPRENEFPATLTPLTAAKWYQPNGIGPGLKLSWGREIFFFTIPSNNVLAIRDSKGF